MLLLIFKRTVTYSDFQNFMPSCSLCLTRINQIAKRNNQLFFSFRNYLMGRFQIICLLSLIGSRFVSSMSAPDRNAAFMVCLAPSAETLPIPGIASRSSLHIFILLQDPAQRQFVPLRRWGIFEAIVYNNFPIKMAAERSVVQLLSTLYQLPMFILRYYRCV